MARSSSAKSPTIILELAAGKTRESVLFSRRSQCYILLAFPQQSAKKALYETLLNFDLRSEILYVKAHYTKIEHELHIRWHCEFAEIRRHNSSRNFKQLPRRSGPASSCGLRRNSPNDRQYPSCGPSLAAGRGRPKRSTLSQPFRAGPLHWNHFLCIMPGKGRVRAPNNMGERAERSLFRVVAQCLLVPL